MAEFGCIIFRASISAKEEALMVTHPNSPKITSPIEEEKALPASWKRLNGKGNSSGVQTGSHTLRTAQSGVNIKERIRKL